MLLLVSGSIIFAQHECKTELELFKDFAIDVGMSGDWIAYLNDKLAQFHYPDDYQNSDTNLLFSFYPTLKEKIPYISFANLPTLIENLQNISKAYGVQVYIKRDDLTGGFDEFGAPIYGGNKVRKLEFLLAQAKFLGAKKVLTFGCAGSNHAVATTVHAHRLGMDAICMLKEQPASHIVQQNLLMHLNYDSELHYSANNDIRKLNALIVWLEHYKRDGQVPYIIPTGGSNIFGVIGFVNAAFELSDQIKKGVMPKPSHIYVACGSCATTAGILLGCKATGLDAHIVAIAIEPEEDPTFAQNIERLFSQTNQYLHSLDNSFPIYSYTDKDLTIDLNFTGPDYGVFTQEGIEAAHQVLTKENIVIEGTYTAKAFVGLLSHVQHQKDALILFWNTYCGLDVSKNLKTRNYGNLLHCLHYYFDDNNLQPLDRST
jgi:D-cysteine desulfhydrase